MSVMLVVRIQSDLPIEELEHRAIRKSGDLG